EPANADEGATPTAGPALVASAASAPQPLGDCSRVALKDVLAIGDSVMVGGAENLAARLGEGLHVSAAVGRQPWDIAALLHERRQAGPPGDIVVLHVGDNGYLTDEELDRIMAELADVRVVIFANVRV